MSVIIFGAGISGLSAAHFLMERGYKVTVVESLGVPGGLSRSERVRDNKGMASEYSWRGFGPWYHNTFDLMKKIPVTSDKTVYDLELSHPITFLFASDVRKDPNSAFSKSSSDRFNKMHWQARFGVLDKIRLYWLAIRAWASSDQRRKDVHSSINASKYISQKLSETGAHAFSQVFGPLVGSDSSRVSLHHVSQFFLRNLFPGPLSRYNRPEPSFTQEEGGLPGAASSLGSGYPLVDDLASGWLILRRPSNESWFDPWVKFLRSKGVKFQFNTSLTRLHFNSGSNTVDYALVETMPQQLASFGAPMLKRVMADAFVLAVNPYITHAILQNSPQLLAIDKQLQKFKPLVDDYPHTQISFRIAFPEKVNFRHTDDPSEETAIILVNSEFDITLFSQDELWNKATYLGDNIKSLWSGTATLDSVPGKLYGLPITKLTKSQFINEVKHQIYRCKELDELIVARNNGRHLKSFPISRIEVWHTWEFPKTACKHKCVIDSYQPKWVNNTRNQKYLPTATTSIPNLYLAGAHTKTNADLYSMEAAVESGRRVADIMAGTNSVIPQHVPHILRPFRVIDSLLYNLGLPNVIDTLIYISMLVLLLILITKQKYFRGRFRR